MNITKGFEEWSAYAGYMQDSNRLKQSASGGAATALSELVIERNGVVFGVYYSNDYKSALYGMATSKEVLEKFKSSKYIIPANNIEIKGELVSVYDVVMQQLVAGKEVLFIGLGCYVAALLNFLNRKSIPTDQLITVDLICHGPTLPKAQELQIAELEKKYNSRVIYFSVKYKKRGWVPPYLIAKFENGKKYLKPFYDSDLGYAMDHYSRDCCSNCQFKGNDHKADITIGDYWGIDENHLAYNKWGVSVILTKTDKGKKIIQDVSKNGFRIWEVDAHHVIKNNPMFYESRKCDRNHEKFHEQLVTIGLHRTVTKNRGLIKSILIKPKRMVSNMLPMSLRNKVKKLLKYGRIRGSCYV